MRTLNIAISDVEYNKFGITADALTFSDFVDLISKELMRENLDAAVDAANTYGLSSMTMGDITREVQAVRRYAEHNN